MDIRIDSDDFDEQQKEIITGSAPDHIAEMGHCPRTVDEAINQLLESDRISRGIKEGRFKDDFILVASLPKSGSSTITKILRSLLGLQSSEGAPWTQVYGNYMIANADSGLRPEMLMGLPARSILKHHSMPSGKNLKLIDLLGCRYFITVRHPADQLTALYCHYRAIVGHAGTRHVSPDERLAYDPIAPFEVTFLKNPDDMEKFFSHVINGGYLKSLCKWMSDWERYRSRERSLLVTYESFFTELDKTVSGVCRFLNAEAETDQVRDWARQMQDQVDSIRQVKTANPDRYPHGFTGDPGVCHKYFSQKNTEEYNAAIDVILASPSMKEGLDSIYDNLRLPH